MSDELKYKLERAMAVIERLREATASMVQPASASIVQQYGRDPFLVLISCLLSLRTKDSTSLPASCRLFCLAKTPQQMLELSSGAIEKAIYPVGFYRVKARTIHTICQDLIDRFDAQVPSGEDDLLSLKGVGRKTMNLVQAEGFGLPAICVDVHVHRIANRLGLVTTKNPDETEKALKALLPQHLWAECNRVFVMWGQNVCVPISPFCSRCVVADVCPRAGVKRSR
jgi:endonuclease-3